MKVFISSVIGGMEELREAAARAVRSLRHEVIRAEDFGAREQSPRAACLAGVRDADALILLIGARYGDLQESGLSATHEEYREARERCPVLVMVERVEREEAQADFLNEVRNWAQGQYTESFAGPDQLRDAVTGALHSLELARATGPVDPEEILGRAIAELPEGERSHAGDAKLALAVAGGPLQSVLRPAELEAADFGERLQRLALFGETAVLTPQQGTETDIANDKLILKQPDRAVSIGENGSIALVSNIPSPETGLPVIIEEDVRGVIGGFLRFASAVLTDIDPPDRLSHIAIAARILNVDYLTWRTRAEHQQSPDSVSMNRFGDADAEPVSLSPPHRTRAALRQSMPDLVEDLTVRLRRQLQNPGKDPW